MAEKAGGLNALTAIRAVVKSKAYHFLLETPSSLQLLKEALAIRFLATTILKLDGHKVPDYALPHVYALRPSEDYPAPWVALENEVWQWIVCSQLTNRMVGYYLTAAEAKALERLGKIT